MTRDDAHYQQTSIEYLKKVCSPAATIYSLYVKSTSAGRLYRVFIVVDGEIREVTRSVSQATGLKWVDGKPEASVFLKGGGFSGAQQIAEQVAEAIDVPCGYKAL